MKKFVIALVIGLLLVAALGTVASADNGPHGGFTNTTEKCAGCHRAHSAKSDDGFLLVAANVYELCMSCHNGGGAYTNVADGVYRSAAIPQLAFPLGQQGDGGAPLFGGGFINTSAAHTWNGKDGYDATAPWPASQPTTSTHTVKGLGTSVGAGTLWGSGNINATEATFTGAVGSALECTSCHDPHGRAGRTAADGSLPTSNAQAGAPNGKPIPSYRLLRFEPEGSNGWEITTGPTAAWWASVNSQSTAGITVRETANLWYTFNTDNALDPTVQFFRTRWDGTAYTAWSSYVAQKGDTAGRNYIYQRPAAVAGGLATGNPPLVGGIVTCKDAGGNLPALPVAQLTANAVLGVNYFDCGVATGTLFNNSATTLAGSGAGNLTAGRAQLSAWCATCHDRYLSMNRTVNSGDTYYTYKHSTSAVPCVDCHASHGTSAVMTVTNGTYPGASKVQDSILMRLDERSICLKCHGHSVNFAYLP